LPCGFRFDTSEVNTALDTGHIPLHLIIKATSTGADELMLVCDTFDPDMRLRALSIAAEQWRLGAEASA